MSRWGRSIAAVQWYLSPSQSSCGVRTRCCLTAAARDSCCASAGAVPGRIRFKSARSMALWLCWLGALNRSNRPRLLRRPPLLQRACSLARRSQAQPPPEESLPVGWMRALNRQLWWLVGCVYIQSFQSTSKTKPLNRSIPKPSSCATPRRRDVATLSALWGAVQQQSRALKEP